ncbi:SRPBCC family protein [Mangrovicella endophytica]|uniref:SRPBCC family protein n=1 Tax=Mangrovicella endophytica TaxID=2066697 RepID=UPI000C9E2665|nr:SRPBCC family protein [Mangrovicella endophytica]
MTKALGMSALVVGLALGASPALALDVSRSIDVDAAPEKVWAVIGGFCGIASWHPVVKGCQESNEGGKDVRLLTLDGGGLLKEQLVSRDEAGMGYTYTILEGPLPVQNYQSTIAVKPGGAGSTIVWQGSFDAKGAPDAEATSVIAGIYDAGLKTIAKEAKR